MTSNVVPICLLCRSADLEIIFCQERGLFSQCCECGFLEILKHELVHYPFIETVAS